MSLRTPSLRGDTSRRTHGYDGAQRGSIRTGAWSGFVPVAAILLVLVWVPLRGPLDGGGGACVRSIRCYTGVTS
jgi:hypothetical protein